MLGFHTRRLFGPGSTWTSIVAKSWYPRRCSCLDRIPPVLGRGVFFFVCSTYCNEIRSGPMALSDWLSCSRGKAGSHHQHHAARSHNSMFRLGASSEESPLGGEFCSKLRAPHRGTSLGPFVCGANKLVDAHSE
jgi:hypothetical protein